MLRIYFFVLYELAPMQFNLEKIQFSILIAYNFSIMVQTQLKLAHLQIFKYPIEICKEINVG